MSLARRDLYHIEFECSENISILRSKNIVTVIKNYYAIKSLTFWGHIRSLCYFCLNFEILSKRADKSENIEKCAKNEKKQENQARNERQFSV